MNISHLLYGLAYAFICSFLLFLEIIQFRFSLRADPSRRWPLIFITCIIGYFAVLIFSQAVVDNIFSIWPALIIIPVVAILSTRTRPDALEDLKQGRPMGIADGRHIVAFFRYPKFRQGTWERTFLNTLLALHIAGTILLLIATFVA